ncbi:hypothetical protein ABK040_010389 [Willaertia magna]
MLKHYTKLLSSINKQKFNCVLVSTCCNYRTNQFNRKEEEKKEDTNSSIFSLEDLEKLKEELVQSLITDTKVPLPSPGKSSGDASIDDATRQWRLTNTKDDEKLKKLFKPVKQKLPKASANLLSQSNSLVEDDDSIEVGIEKEDEKEQYVNPYNPETGEMNGPVGAEPTRFGDWERKGRCIDF